MKSFKGFIIATVLLTTVFVFSGIYIFTTVIYDRFMSNYSADSSKALVQHSFNVIGIGMRQGLSRDELTEIINETSEAFRRSKLRLKIYRGKKVSDAYGTIETDVITSEINSVLNSGKQMTIKDGGQVLDIVPIKAKTSCTQCHTNVVPGEVLGALTVSQDITDLRAALKREVLMILLFVSPLPLAFAIILTLILNRKIHGAIDVFQEEINKVSSIDDLSKLKIDKVDTGFTELNSIYKDISVLADKMKSIAADKDVLEFEVKLLDKLILTTEAVTNWKAYIKEIIMEINEVIELNTIFCLFETEDNANVLEIFWKCKPSVAVKQMFEETIMREFKMKRVLTEKGIRQINHNIVNSGENMNCPSPDHNLGDYIKFISYEKNNLGGTVGAGILSPLVSEHSTTLIIETTLTTLLNVVGSSRAIHKYTKDIEFYATRDPLTNLHNQQMFWDQLRAESTRSHRHESTFSLIIIDFDNFKLINDIYGHGFGDKLLKKYASAMNDAKREEDILARYGGDEFTMILPEADEKQAYSVSKRLKERIEAVGVIADDGKNVKATVSIGIACFPLHAQEDRQLFLVANNMMYKAKREGKNRIAVPSGQDITESMKEIGEKNQLILNALETKSLMPFFQPIITLQDKTIETHELLMRIRQGDHIIPAYQFVDDAENMGVMHKLDLILMEKAFQMIKDNNYTGQLFVNLSPKSLIIEDYVSEVLKITDKYNINTEKIVLEITERETVRNISSLEQFIKGLKSAGFKFAIDDFGSGFSSFHYIKKFPIDIIKIEGEFIQNLLEERVDRAFVKSILTIAQELKIETVAEFVETKEVMSSLIGLGVDYAQGYYIDKPGPILTKSGTKREEL